VAKTADSEREGALPESLDERLGALLAAKQEAEAERDKATHERDEYRKLYELVRLELERTRRHLFAKEPEGVSKEQLALALEAVEKKLEEAAVEESNGEPDEDDKLIEDKTGKSGKGGKARPHGRQKLPEHFPEHRIELVPAEVDGHEDAFKRIGEEVSTTLEYCPSSMVRVVVVRGKYIPIEQVGGAASSDEEPDAKTRVLIAEVPDKAIERGLAGPGMLAHVLISKYCDHLPLHRQERIFARAGLNLKRSTMCGWLAATTELLGVVVEAMWEDALATSSYIATDATGVLVRKPKGEAHDKKCHYGHFWVAIAESRHVLFEYTDRHDNAALDSLFAGYDGYLVADAHVVYDHLYANGATEVACWAHARRYFFKAMSSDPERAKIAIGFMRKLFRIEAAIVDEPRKRRERIRKRKSAPIAKAFFDWCDEQWDLVIEASPIFDAIRYSRNQRAALLTFITDGRLPMHNNASERQLRHQAVGRKNWLFIGHPDAAKWNTVTVSLIASCKLHGIEPWAYLRDLLCLLPAWPKSRALDLAPVNWKQTSEQSHTQQLLARDPFRQATLHRAAK